MPAKPKTVKWPKALAEGSTKKPDFITHEGAVSFKGSNNKKRVNDRGVKT